MGFCPAATQQLSKDMPKTTFADVAGVDEAVDGASRDQGLPQNPAGTKAWPDPQRRFSLYGPPNR